MSVDTPDTRPDHPAGAPSTATRWAVTGVAAVLAAALAWLVLGTPGLDRAGDQGDRADDDRRGEAAAGAVDTLSPDEFADRMTDPDAFVVNVHIPYEGELDGTDAFIPFDEIAGDARLPADEDTEILLYCRSGNMSETATRTLEAEGYTDVAHLGGGMQEWSAAGREVVQREG
jgi:rhodanese-related sulfurtransferase